MVKYLIIKQSSLGDIVHTLPVLNAIKNDNPKNMIGFVVADKFQDVVKNHPLIDKLYIVPREKFKKSKIKVDILLDYVKLIMEIRKEKYDIAIDYQRIIKSGIILGPSGAKRRISKKNAREGASFFANELIEDNFYDSSCIQAVKNHLRTLEFIGIKSEGIYCQLPESTQESIKLVSKLEKDLDPQKPKICLCPATTWPNKHWKQQYWSELLDYLKEYNVIFTGSVNDNDLVEKIVNDSSNKNYLNLCGKTNINALMEVFRKSDIVVSPDSGSAHLAWGTGVPSVIVLFCATPASLYGPIGDKHFSLPKTSNCIACHKRDCQKETQRYCCCEFIKPIQVFDTIKKALESAIFAQ